MSADAFQTKYASVMEGMLKSAIAETTKLFENMVDELKAEISQIRKENEDLKKKCFQYETARSKPVKPAGESSPAQERSGVSEKCDSAVQCDIVPYCTVLVEECQPLMESAPQNQGHQCTLDSKDQNFHDHNYFKSGNPEMSVVLVKQEELDNVSFEFALKEEKADNDVVPGHFLTNKSIRTSTGTQHEKPRISQESSAEQISSPKKNNETGLVFQLPLGINSNSQGVQSPEIKHSFVISLKDALRDDIKVESDVFQKKTELSSPGKRKTPRKQLLIPQESHLDSPSSISEHTRAVVQQHLGVHTVSELLPESIRVNKEMVFNLPEGKANNKPAPRRKGRLPKKTPKKSLPSPVTGVSRVSDNLTIPVTRQTDTVPSLPVVTGTVSLSESSKASPSDFIKTLCLVSPVVHDNANMSLEGQKRKIGPLPSLVEPLSCSLLYEKQTVNSLQNSTEVEHGADARSFEHSLESQTPLTPHRELPQAPSAVHRKCCTPVSLQDALLLVDAMNQSSMDHTVTPSQTTPQPQVHSASPISPSETSAAQQTPPVEAQPTVKTLDASAPGTVVSLDQHLVLIPKQPQKAASLNTPTLPVSSSVPLVAATEAAAQPRPLPRINLAAMSNISRKIIIVKRPALSKASKTSGMLQTPPSKAESTDLKMNPSPSSCGKPVIPSPQQSTQVTVRELDPILPLQSTTIATHHEASPNITVSPIQVPTDASNKPVLAEKQDTTVPATSVSLPLPQLSSILEESSLSTADDSLAIEKNDSTRTLDPPNQTTFACTTNISRKKSDLSSETIEPVQTLVSAEVPPAAEQKLCAVVRLVRLPPSVSTQKSVSISKLQEDQAWGLFKQMSAMPTDKSDPRFQMTKARIPEQPSTSSSLQNEVSLNKRSNANKTETGTKNAKRPRVKSRKRHVKNKTKTKSKVVKMCKAEVWYPPTLPPNEVPIVDKIPEPRLKVEFRNPVIPLQPTPTVSPLQPLAVIGRHLLRNQCGECGRVFESTTALESHVSLHKIYRPFTCKLCGKYFPDSKTFKRHDRVHRNGRIHLCPLCGKGFVYRYAVGKHIQMVHRKLKPFICQICNKEFHSKLDVEGHIRSHTGERPYKCDLCERRFIRRIELNLHLRWHKGEKRHWCPYCGKGFLDGNNLKRHKLTHTGEKPHACPHCPKKFTQSAHLKKHVSSVHKDKTK